MGPAEIETFYEAVVNIHAVSGAAARSRARLLFADNEILIFHVALVFCIPRESKGECYFSAREGAWNSAGGSPLARFLAVSRRTSFNTLEL